MVVTMADITQVGIGLQLSLLAEVIPMDPGWFMEKDLPAVTI